MSEEPEQGPDLQGLKEAVRQTVASGRDLQEKVRDLMLSALSTAHLDVSRIQQVTRAALEGVGAGAGTEQAVRKSVDGIEDALLQAAEASSLAIQEAAGRAAEFSRSDLRRAVDDLASLEALFMDTLGDVARAGSETARAAFADIQRHLQNSGTTFGTQLAEHAGELRKLLPQVGREGPGADAARKAADQLSRIASGFLAGIERGLEEAGRNSSGNDEADKPGDI